MFYTYLSAKICVFYEKRKERYNHFFHFVFFHDILIITADEKCKHEYLSDSDSILFDVSPQAIIKKFVPKFIKRSRLQL